MECEQLAKIACMILPPGRLAWEQKRMKNIIRIHLAKDKQTNKQTNKQFFTNKAVSQDK